MTSAYNFYCLSRKPTGKSFFNKKCSIHQQHGLNYSIGVQSFSWRKALEVEGKEF